MAKSPQVWTRLPAPILEKVKDLAAQERRPRANMIALLVEEAVAARRVSAARGAKAMMA